MKRRSGTAPEWGDQPSGLVVYVLLVIFVVLFGGAAWLGVQEVQARNERAVAQLTKPSPTVATDTRSMVLVEQSTPVRTPSLAATASVQPSPSTARSTTPATAPTNTPSPSPASAATRAPSATVSPAATVVARQTAITSPTPTVAPAPPTPTQTVVATTPAPVRLGTVRTQTGAAARVRAQPNQQSAQLASLDIGSRVEILSVVNGEAVDPSESNWYQIRSGQVTGYVYALLVVLD